MLQNDRLQWNVRGKMCPGESKATFSKIYKTEVLQNLRKLVSL